MLAETGFSGPISLHEEYLDHRNPGTGPRASGSNQNRFGSTSNLAQNRLMPPNFRPFTSSLSKRLLTGNHPMKCLLAVLAICLWCASPSCTFAQINGTEAPIFVWPDLAPETQRTTGTQLPMRAVDKPPILRIEKIRRPPMHVYPATGNANGAAVLILPGGGFGKVVPNLEGSEAAEWLCQMGVTCFVLNYRTRLPGNTSEPPWKRSHKMQRAMRWIRANAKKWNLDPEQIGLLAFSAGGQVGRS